MVHIKKNSIKKETVKENEIHIHIKKKQRYSWAKNW